MQENSIIRLNGSGIRVLTVEGKLHRQGKKGISISLVMEKLLPTWTGQLSKVIFGLDTSK
jgi:hypothetical protein